MKALAALVCVAALTAASASAQPVAGPVTGVKVSPSPFFSDEPLMRVTFRARRPAPAGYLYFVAWYTLARPSTPSAGCSLTSKIDALGHKGGFNVRVNVVLSPEPLFGDAFCPGPSELRIFTQLATAKRKMSPKATRRTYHRVATLTFRVLRP